jgi:hypothetical protein
MEAIQNQEPNGTLWHTGKRTLTVNPIATIFRAVLVPPRFHPLFWLQFLSWFSRVLIGTIIYVLWSSIPSTCSELNFLILGVGWDWVHLVRRPVTGPLYQPRMIDDDECGAVGGMRIGRWNRSTRRKPAPVPFYPSQNPRDLTWDRRRAAGMRSWRLTAWAMARSPLSLIPYKVIFYFLIVVQRGARGSVVGWVTMLQAGRLRVRVPM